MPRKKLHETLNSLHEQLQADPPLDAADRAHLSEILQDIAKVVDEDKPHESVGDQVNDAVVRFETSHPTIATALHEIIELLKRL